MSEILRERKFMIKSRIRPDPSGKGIKRNLMISKAHGVLRDLMDPLVVILEKVIPNTLLPTPQVAMLSRELLMKSVVCIIIALKSVVGSTMRNVTLLITLPSNVRNAFLGTTALSCVQLRLKTRAFFT